MAYCRRSERLKKGLAKTFQQYCEKRFSNLFGQDSFGPNCFSNLFDQDGLPHNFVNLFDLTDLAHNLFVDICFQYFRLQNVISKCLGKMFFRKCCIFFIWAPISFYFGDKNKSYLISNTISESISGVPGQPPKPKHVILIMLSFKIEGRPFGPRAPPRSISGSKILPKWNSKSTSSL